MRQEGGFSAEEIDTSRPHPARIYDYLLGGKDNYEVDRKAGDELAAAASEVRIGVQSNREFPSRAVRHVVSNGIRQSCSRRTERTFTQRAGI